MNKTLLILTSILIASCASNSGVTNFQSKGNLEASKPADCVSIEQLVSEQNPSDIFVGMKKCLDSEKYEMAAKCITPQ